ncbi:RNA methyltransferase [Enterococcus sp. BWT-B8]|uniref:TrmH family RNA methyltransferase n=1 Tax=Enterococcus sp. BWT-B8 TaxID=2885157 RepID=UPI001E5C0DCF|nr:RNA methyltransferase [Enterococcus sp. BWT-B8]MCB5950515.1 RNA methyltransferase [Enterococcus sp. BWT-B8]
MKEIMSNKNELIKKIRKLYKKKGREEARRYVIEGFHLVEEAVRFSAPVEWILFDERGRKEWGEWLSQYDDEKLIFVSQDVMKSLSELPTPQGIIGVVAIPDEVEVNELQGHWLALDNVQDPGNVGTMIRTADAAGYAGVIIGEGTADIYNSKVLRAMQGSHFHLPVLRKKIEMVIDSFKSKNIPVFGTKLDEKAVHYTSVAPKQNSCLIMGNEGQGVSPELLDQTDQNIYIPIRGEAESLNVAVAAGILMYHLSNGLYR